MKKTIYKSVLTIEVLSDIPLPENVSLTDIVYEITDGDMSGLVNWKKRNIPIKGKKAIKEVVLQGSDPGFFNMDENGNEKNYFE